MVLEKTVLARFFFRTLNPNDPRWQTAISKSPGRQSPSQSSPAELNLISDDAANHQNTPGKMTLSRHSLRMPLRPFRRFLRFSQSSPVLFAESWRREQRMIELDASQTKSSDGQNRFLPFLSRSNALITPLMTCATSFRRGSTSTMCVHRS